MLMWYLPYLISRVYPSHVPFTVKRYPWKAGLKGKISPDFKGIQDAKDRGYKIGVTAGYSYNEEFWQIVPYKNGATSFQPQLSGSDLHDQLESTTKQDTKYMKI
jgi:hypothetical protein